MLAASTAVMELSREIFILVAENSTDEPNYGDFESYQEVCLQEENADFNRIFLPIIFSVIFLTGMIGNILVIVVVGYQRKLRSMTDKYRLHLSVADLLFATTLSLWSVDAVIGWHFGNHLCKMVHSIYTINLHSSVLILAFISLDQYLAIVHATNSQRLRELLVKRYVYVGVWLPALLLAIPDIVFANTCRVSEKYVCQRFYPHDIWLIAFRFEYIWMGFVLPSFMMLTCYCIVISKLSQSKGYQKRKALKTTVILIVVFLACWLPYHIGISIDTFVLLGFIENGCSFETILHKCISITEALAFFHCCLNPILYAFLGVKFRATTRGTLNSISRASSLRVLSLVK